MGCVLFMCSFGAFAVSSAVLFFTYDPGSDPNAIVSAVFILSAMVILAQIWLFTKADHYDGQEPIEPRKPAAPASVALTTTEPKTNKVTVRGLLSDNRLSEKAVKARYRTLVKQTHPDHGGNADDFIEVTAEYNKIKKERVRK
jgi:hypothetical protein